MKIGLTNVSFKFTVNGTNYVYRKPGTNTKKYIGNNICINIFATSLGTNLHTIDVIKNNTAANKYNLFFVSIISFMVNSYLCILDVISAAENLFILKNETIYITATNTKNTQVIPLLLVSNRKSNIPCIITGVIKLNILYINPIFLLPIE